MTQMELEKAGPDLARLVRLAARGEEVVLTVENQPVARVAAVAPDFGRPRFGRCPGLIRHMAEDFDAPLDDLADYMR